MLIFFVVLNSDYENNEKQKLDHYEATYSRKPSKPHTYKQQRKETINRNKRIMADSPQDTRNVFIINFPN